MRESLAAQMGRRMATRLILFFALALVMLTAPANAADGSAQVPEASNLTLFALGLAGLIIGRRAAMKKNGKSGKDD